MAEENPAAQRQTSVTDYFLTVVCLFMLTLQRQTAVTAYFPSNNHQLLFTFPQYASTRWQKSILHLKDKQQQLLTF